MKPNKINVNTIIARFGVAAISTVTQDMIMINTPIHTYYMFMYMWSVN